MNKFISFVLLTLLAGHATADANLDAEVEQILKTHKGRCRVYNIQLDLAKQVVDHAPACWEVIQDGSLERYEVRDYETHCKHVEAITGRFYGAQQLFNYTASNAPKGDVQMCYGSGNIINNLNMIDDAEFELKRLYENAE